MDAILNLKNLVDYCYVLPCLSDEDTYQDRRINMSKSINLNKQ